MYVSLVSRNCNVQSPPFSLPCPHTASSLPLIWATWMLILATVYVKWAVQIFRASPRLWVVHQKWIAERETMILTFIIRARHLSYQRGKRNTNPKTSCVAEENSLLLGYILMVTQLNRNWRCGRPTSSDVSFVQTLLRRVSCLNLYGHSFYLGKKVAFVYRAHREIRGTKIRVIWGKVTRRHGMIVAATSETRNVLNDKHRRQLGSC